MTKQARLSVDVGGTFTDIVLEGSHGRRSMKVLTTPAEPEKAVIEGITAILDATDTGIVELGMFVHGTTLATNAILERKGASMALITTQGFRDVIEIGTESRYDQYELALKRPDPLVERPRRYCIPERMDARGNCVLALDEQAIRETALRLVADGVESVAVCFLHSYLNPAHEDRCRDIFAEVAPEIMVSLSYEVCPEIREYERASTTIVNAYVQPLMSNYLERLDLWLQKAGFRGYFCLMTSSGGLCSVDAARRFPVRLVESGPAGGAIFASLVAGRSDERRVIAFDMGGTTAKVSLISDFEAHMARDFEIDRAARFLKGSGLPIRIPVIEMIEIGAGGGSIATIDDLGRLRVGPRSASSVPGPACYDRGGTEPTVTDADAVIGLVDPATFSGGAVKLDIDKASRAIAERIGAQLNIAAPLAAHGLYEVVCENMASAARVHAAERGATLEKFSMVAFGGAAPLHAARVAEKIGIERIIIPANAGVGSAVGFLSAPLSFQTTRSHYMILGEGGFESAEAVLAEMTGEIRALIEPGAHGRQLIEKRCAYMRYIGQGHEIAVDLPSGTLTKGSAATLRSAYESAYLKLYKRVIPDARIEVLAWSVTISTEQDTPCPVAKSHPRRKRTSPNTRAIYDGGRGEEIRVPFHLRDDLEPSDMVPGPALIGEQETTVYIPAAFDAWIDNLGSIVLQRKPNRAS
jgi:N-methylhydantoinase A